jgi:hypothetical protein
MFEYARGMVYIVSESGGGSQVFHRWRCDQCNDLGPWTFDRDKAERGRQHHVCEVAAAAAGKAD